MNREKTTAAFLADCLAHMPRQPDQVQRAVDIAIDGLNRISNGGDWPEGEARAAARAAWAAASDAAWAASDAAYWAADAAYWAADAAYWAADAAYWAAGWAATRAAANWAAADWAAWAARAVDTAADYAARAHPDPGKEVARQAKVREEMGL